MTLRFLRSSGIAATAALLLMTSLASHAAAASASRPARLNGHAGFSFVKLGADGSALPANATIWSCIADQVTGFVWEMKTDDGGIHDKDDKYTNYGNGSAGDASTLVIATNQQALCGRTNWRLPTRGELQGIVDYSVAYPGPTIDAAWFPNSDGYSFWTSTGQIGNSAGSWYVNFTNGFTGVLSDSYAFGQVRLVSGAGFAGSRFTVLASGDEVADAATGLVWQRCSVGQAWSGTTCTGAASKFAWQELLKQAASGSGWRVPNAKELASLASDSVTDPSIDATYFPATPTDLYWTSSPSASAPLNAWTVYFFDSSVNEESSFSRFRLRLVRNAN